MLLQINQTTTIDSLKINFSNDSLWILNIALAIIMFGVALGITLNDFKRLFNKPIIFFTGIISQFILLPAMTFIAILIFQPQPSFALGMILIAACPGGNISNFFSKLANGNAALSVSLTAFATLICIVMTPFNFHFWGSLYPPTNSILKSVQLDAFDLFKLVSLILGAPLILGMLLKHYCSNLSIQIEKKLKPISILFFLVLIMIAFSKNFDIFTNYIHEVLFLVIFHNLVAFLTGFYSAKLMKLSTKDRKTITIETGIQNGGLGLLLIFSFFDGLGGMALIAAFWGIWHIFSGMLLATYWSKR